MFTQLAAVPRDAGCGVHKSEDLQERQQGRDEASSIRVEPEYGTSRTTILLCMRGLLCVGCWAAGRGLSESAEDWGV